MPDMTFTRTALPATQFEGDIGGLFDLFTSHLVGTLSGQTLIGQIGGGAPGNQILWLNGNVWYAWNGVLGQYEPLPIVTGAYVGAISQVVTTQLRSTATADNITLYLPNKNGATLATKDDIIAASPGTKSVSGNAFVVDWTELGYGGILYANLTANVILTEATVPRDGSRIDIYFEQALSASGALTVTWPTPWIISTGAVLTTRASATTRYIDHFSLRRVGEKTFVEQGKGSTIATSGGGGGGTAPSDTTPPIVTDVTVPVSTRAIVVTWDETLQGGTLSPAKWSVKRNGVTNAVSSVVATGSSIRLVVANTYGSTTTGTVRYTPGTGDVKDTAGNAAIDTGILNITVDTSGTGEGGGGGLVP